jgi:hypothetical protein
MNHPSLAARRDDSALCSCCDDRRWVDVEGLPAYLNGAPDRPCPQCHCTLCDTPIKLAATEFDALGRALCLDCLADDMHSSYVTNRQES